MPARRTVKPRSFAIRVVVGGLASVLLGLTLGTGCQVAKFRFVNPGPTPIQKTHEGATRSAWLDLEDMAPDLVAAVILSEDARFFDHEGFDTLEVSNAVRDAVFDGKRLRGASTLTQQLAKNLFSMHERTLWRKGREAYYTILLELLLGKARILELYLNVAQFGPREFGVEAGARRHFGTSARRLSRAQAAEMAALLPSPSRGLKGAPHSERARRVMRRLNGPGGHVVRARLSALGLR